MIFTNHISVSIVILAVFLWRHNRLHKALWNPEIVKRAHASTLICNALESYIDFIHGNIPYRSYMK